MRGQTQFSLGNRWGSLNRDGFGSGADIPVAKVPICGHGSRTTENEFPLFARVHSTVNTPPFARPDFRRTR